MDCCCIKYIVVISVIVMLYFLRQWFKGSKCNSKVRLDDKTVVITGANTGIGKETAVYLAKRGATVVMACRDMKRGEAALTEVKGRSGSSKVFLKILDLASLASIREFSTSFLAEYTKLHILINNAGVGGLPLMKTEDGFEMHIGVNHLGHFALTNLLLKRIVESAPSRIVNVSSVLHGSRGVTVKFDDINSEKDYNPTFAYSQSKLANILFTKELNRKLQGSGVTTYSLHPGLVETDIWRNMNQHLKKILLMLIQNFFGKSAEQGAQTTIYCAVEEGIESLSGMYFSDCAIKEPSKVSCDEGMAKKLWEMSEEMTKVKFPM